MSSINSVRNLQILYFSKKDKKIKNLYILLTSKFKQVFERLFYKYLQYYYCPTKLKNFFKQRF